MIQDRVNPFFLEQVLLLFIFIMCDEFAELRTTQREKFE